MELKWLEDFLVLSTAGNFRIAAQQRCVSQPAFSRRIQALEAWIEAPLIDRTRQPSQLTDAGKLFLTVAQKIVDLAEAGKAKVQTQILEEAGKNAVFDPRHAFPDFHACLVEKPSAVH